MTFTAGRALSQKEAELVYKGNGYYHNGQMENAIQHYREALKNKQDFKKANFNLGDAIYKEAMGVKKSTKQAMIMGMKPDSLANIMLDEAAGQFDVVSQTISDKDTVHKALHNLGNCRLMQKNYQGAVDAYKKSLKVDPRDEDTRYNLAYALKKLKEQQKNNKDKNQQQQQQNQNKDQQQQKQQQQQQQPKMSKEEAERMLNALKNSEQKLQGKKKKGEGEKVKTEKDW
ncbi:MAG: tetratricopeptide repeat protein [Bacteroidia bacterium]